MRNLMPARPVIKADIEQLKRNWAAQMPLKQMASEVGCCVDTLKRILNREGIAIFPAAKYQTSKRQRQQVWERPCLSCGSKKPRPKWQYICNKCKELHADFAWWQLSVPDQDPVRDQRQARSTGCLQSSFDERGRRTPPTNLIKNFWTKGRQWRDWRTRKPKATSTRGI